MLFKVLHNDFVWRFWSFLLFHGLYAHRCQCIPGTGQPNHSRVWKVQIWCSHESKLLRNPHMTRQTKVGNSCTEGYQTSRVRSIQPDMARLLGYQDRTKPNSWMVQISLDQFGLRRRSAELEPCKGLGWANSGSNQVEFGLIQPKFL